MCDITLSMGPSEPVTVFVTWFDENNVNLWTFIQLDVDGNILRTRLMSHPPVYVRPVEAVKANSLKEFNSRWGEAMEERRSIRRQIYELENQLAELKAQL